MNALSKIILIGCILLVTAALALHGDFTPDPGLPRDMPPDAHFIPTGYNLDQNERRGTWVSCQAAPSGEASFCRITDGHGMVIFQAAYLPVGDSQYPESASATSRKIANQELRWAMGPTEGMEVPLIPMTDGSLLVPALDRQLLVAHWLRDPDEWQSVRIHR